MSEPKKHHYVPECYLRTFTNSKKEFWRLNKKYRNISICSPGMVCYEKDLFKIKREETLLLNNISDVNYVEKDVFKQQENNYGGIINNIIKFSETGITIEKDKYFLFLKMLVTTKRKNPSVRKGFMEKEFQKEFASRIGQQRLREYLQRMSDLVGDKINVDEYIEKHYHKNIDDEKLHDISLSSFFTDNAKTDLSDQIATDLYLHKQFILHAPIGSSFVTCDNPGFTEIEGQILNFGGFGQPFRFYFPLSSNTCLLVDSTKLEDKNAIEKTVYPVVTSESIVEGINRTTFELAMSYIFGHSKEILSRLDF